MSTTTFLSWWALPAPIFFGVLASWVPISASVMIGLATTAAVYTGLVLLAQFDDAEELEYY